MSWREFSILLGGLGPETPLSRIVAIRSEKDPKVIRDMTQDQKKIRNEWRKRQFAKKSKAEQEKDVQALIRGVLRAVGVQDGEV